MATTTLQGNGRTVQVIRRFRLLSQAQLAERVGKPKTWVTNVEACRTSLLGDELEAVAKALDVGVEVLASPAARKRAS